MNDRARIGRRRFVRLAAAAATSAAVLTMNPIAAAPAPAAPKPAPKKRVRSKVADPSVRAEIENQKKQLATILEVIRSYDRPAGSPPALVFRPLPPRRHS
jgi:hypothetical protein